ncbi:MAG: AraC family transcriptional regulator [Thiohalocapsa sp. PB-PSB1]|jgi:AraC-like DNA-binding protein|nr:MAG: AraC family transcriptional regulator [Thiohalocapsa sp. PB-PSB1]
MVETAAPTLWEGVARPSASQKHIEKPGRLDNAHHRTEIDCVVPAGSQHVVALVSEDRARAYLGEALGCKLWSREDRHLICHPSVSESLIQLVHRLVRNYFERRELLADREICKASESKLMETFVQAVDSMDSGVGSISARKRHLAFLRAIEYAEQLQLPIGVSEFASAAGVSRRVLELAFRETLGVTPVTYLRLSRMHGVRRKLAAADSDSARVKEICACWGFSDPGRFAVDYGRMFGESPSTTLRNCGKRPPKRLVDALRGSSIG